MSEQLPSPIISEPLFLKNAASYWRIVLWLEAGFCTFALLMVLAFSHNMFFEALIYIGIACPILLPICMIFAGTQIGYLHKKMGKIYFNGELVSLFDKSCRHTYTTKLTDCRWFIGSRAWATVPLQDALFGLGAGRAFLIVFPDSITTVPGCRLQHIEQPVIIAAGLTPETRLQWEQAAERLNVQQVIDRRFAKSPLPYGVAAALVPLILIGSFIFGMWFARMVDVLLHQWNVPGDIVEGIAVPCFYMFFLCFMLFTFLLLSCGRIRENKKYFNIGRGISWIDMLAMLCVPQCVSIITYWQGIDNRVDWTIRTAVAATITQVVLTLLMLYPLRLFWRRINGEPPKGE